MQSQFTDQIIERIAERENKKPDELDIIIHNHIPMDAVETLMRHDSNSWRLQFETESHVIEVAGNGTILIDGEPS